MRVTLRSAIPTLILLLAAAACGTTATAPSTSVGTQTFTYNDSTQIMVGWDPATDYSEELVAFGNMYEGLTHYNAATRTVEPLLATSWSKNADGTEWTFHLRHGVAFHTGRPFNAAAVKASIERTVKLGQAASYEWGPVKSITTPGTYTVVFHLSRPAPLDLIASSSFSAFIYDTHAAGSGDLAKWFAAGHDAGTGPYTVQQWQKGQEIELRLKSFAKYWGGWHGSHYTRIVYRVTPDASTSVQLLRANQVTFVRQLSPQLIGSLKGTPGIRVVQTSSWTNMFAMLNTQRPPLNNASVRQALAWGIDYAGIQAVNKGAMLPGGSIIPPGLIGYTNNLPEYKYDPAKAKALLQAAGYGPGGKPINLTLTYIVADALETPVAQLMKSSLSQLNVNLQLQALQWPVLWAKTKSSNLASRQDIALYEWYPDYADPYSWFINMFTTQNPVIYNATYYSNPTVDSLGAQASKATATDPPKAQSLYEELQRKLLEEVPAIPLGTVQNQYGMRDSFSGFLPNPAYQGVVFVYKLKPTGSG
jgi:peptide/nickel transport system substrate-binding protein